MGNKVRGMKGLRTLEHTFTYKHAHIMHITRLWLRIYCGVEVTKLSTNKNASLSLPPIEIGQRWRIYCFVRAGMRVRITLAQS